MAVSTTQTDTLDWFRNTAPYINTHRGTTVVVGLRHGATTHHNFINVVHDLALMQSLGLRLVIVHEHQPIPLTPVPSEAMPTLIASILEARTHIERMFSMGLPNSPLHNARLRVIGRRLPNAESIDSCTFRNRLKTLCRRTKCSGAWGNLRVPVFSVVLAWTR